MSYVLFGKILLVPTREKEIRDMAQHLLVLIKSFFSHATTTISLTECIVNMALVLYLLESPTIAVEHDLIVEESGGVNIQSRLDDISLSIAAFYRHQISVVRETLSGQYEVVERTGSIAPINADRYVVGDLVDSVIEAAREMNLRMTVSYCTNISENYHYIATAFFWGCYPRMLGKNEMPTEAHYSGPRKPRASVKPVLSTIPSDSVNRNVEHVPNQFFLTKMSSYCRTEWVKVLPSLSCDIPRLLRVAITLHDKLFVLRGTIYYDRNANGH
jgi:hypothetical protein